jgi:hypothetical protein
MVIGNVKGKTAVFAYYSWDIKSKSKQLDGDRKCERENGRFCLSLFALSETSDLL